MESVRRNVEKEMGLNQKRVDKRLQIAVKTVARVKAVLDQTSLNSALKFNDFQMLGPPYFEPPGAPKSPNWRPKRGRNELQNCAKTLSEFWLVTKIDFERDFDQFPANVEGENYEKTWEGCSKLSFAELSNQSSSRTYFETISKLNWAQIRLQNGVSGD